MSDRESKGVELLLSKFLGGDITSFEQIYKSYYPMLYNYGRQFGTERSDIDDYIQDVFLEIWNSRDRLSIKVLKPYLFRCLRNKIIKSSSKSQREKNKSQKYWREEFEVVCDPAFITFESQEQSDLERKLQQCMEQLSTRQREIVFLIFYNDLSYSEAAQVLGIKLKTVYNQVYNSINTLKKMLIVLYAWVLCFF